MAAHHGDGAHAQAHAGVQAKQAGGHHRAQDILQGHHHDGQQKEEHHLQAAPLEQLEGGGIPHAGEEDGHEKVLQGGAEGDLHHAGGVQPQMDEGVHQAPHHRGRDAVLAQQGDLLDHQVAQGVDQTGHRQALIQIEGNRQHFCGFLLFSLDFSTKKYPPGFQFPTKNVTEKQNL